MSLTTINKAIQEDIFELLLLCDNDFIPPLSQRVDLFEYSLKLYKIAVNFEVWKNNKLIGLLSAYLNNIDTKTGYITNLCVVKEYAGKGIASVLLEKCLTYAGENHFIKIELEVNKQNIPAIKFYNKYKFKYYTIKKNSIIMQKKIEKYV